MNEEPIDHALEQLPAMPPAVANRIRAQIKSDTRPARPMMSDAAYVLIFACAAAAAALLFAALLGFKALQLAPVTVIAMLAVIAVMAAWSGLMVARTMRPGSGRVFGLLSGAMAVIAYEAVVMNVFSSYSMTLFVHRGMTCLSLGVACGVVASVPIWLVARRGFAVERLKSGAMIGLLSGLAGLAALTLHCPVFEVPHAAVWHGGVILVCVAAGMLVSRLRSAG